MAAGAAWAAADLTQVEDALAFAAHQQQPSTIRGAATALTPAQRAAVEALVGRIIPAVDGRPGAREAGAARFIDRALATFNSAQKTVYADGIADLDRRARAAAPGAAGFAALQPPQQDAVLREIRADAVLPDGALRHHRGDVRVADLRRQRRLQRLAHDRLRSSAAFPGAVRLLRRRCTERLMAIQEPRPAAVRYRPSDIVDFVIVGSGAAGGIIAKELSTAGFRVVVLEQGPRLTEAQFDHDEFGTFMRNKHANNPATQPQTFRPTPQAQARAQLSLILRAARGREQRALHGERLAVAADRLR
ncbi:MAG: gluconate 2-dehydrogenase subunit 3 family protein [Vicinamibacterales bacterium]